MAEKRYYWLKLHKDFFKRHEVRIIEDMPNGKDYILFYLKLLVESVTHEGALRFSDAIPYNEQMLATITNTNVDIVKAAMQIFIELHMVELLDDQTIFMAEVAEMIGSETEAAKIKRQQRQNNIPLEQCRRLNQEMLRLPSGKTVFVDEKRYGGNGMLAYDLAGGKCEMCGSEDNLCIHHGNGYSNDIQDLYILCRKCHSKVEHNEGVEIVHHYVHQSIENRDKRIDIRDKSIDKEVKRFQRPSVEEVAEYCKEKNLDVNPKKFINYYDSNGWKVGKVGMKDWKAACRSWAMRKEYESSKGVNPDKLKSKPSYDLEEIKKRSALNDDFDI